jgi:hypothetical protein
MKAELQRIQNELEPVHTVLTKLMMRCVNEFTPAIDEAIDDAEERLHTCRNELQRLISLAE